MIRIRYILLCFLSMVAFSIVGFSEEAEAKDIKVKAIIESGPDKELSELNDSVIFSNGRVLLPIREVGDKLSLKVFWDQSKKTASLYGVNKEIKLTIGSKVALINNKETSLDVAAKVIDGKTYIPLKFVATASGESITWNASSKMLTMSRSYAIGNENELTYWINLKTGEVSKAVGQEPGKEIGKLEANLSILKNFSVNKLSEDSSYIYYNQISGPSGTVKVSGQALIINDKIVNQGNFLVMGYYPVTNIQKVQENVLITDGKTANFLNKQGEIISSYKLTELMGKDEAYMIENYSNDFMILREYKSQHLIVYDFKMKEAIYVHEVIELPVYEKEYLIQAGLDRANEMEYDHIITFDKVDNEGNLLFKYKSKKTNQIDTYKLAL